MTDLLFTNARLIDPEKGSETHGTLGVKNGRIVAAQGLEGAEHIDCNGKCLAPGIVDIGVKVSEPGERHKESFSSAGRAAAAGGVTTMVTRPDTLPAIDTPEVREFVRRRANEAAPVHVLPMAALTRGRLTVTHRAGVRVNPFTRRFSICSDLGVNYMLVDINTMNMGSSFSY